MVWALTGGRNVYEESFTLDRIVLVDNSPTDNCHCAIHVNLGNSLNFCDHL
jgi:hypothetical protein